MRPLDATLREVWSTRASGVASAVVNPPAKARRLSDRAERAPAPEPLQSGRLGATSGVWPIPAAPVNGIAHSDGRTGAHRPPSARTIESAVRATGANRSGADGARIRRSIQSSAMDGIDAP